MALLIVRHKVKDFAAWKKTYDADVPRRTAAGLSAGRVTRSVADPSEVILVFEASDIEKAKAMGASPGLKEAMQAAGVIDKPDIYLTTDA